MKRLATITLAACFFAAPVAALDDGGAPNIGGDVRGGTNVSADRVYSDSANSASGIIVPILLLVLVAAAVAAND